STSSSAHARSSHCWVGKNGYRFALVNAFAELLDHFLVERREISGLPTCDQPVVRHHLLVHPFRSGILQVCLNRRIGGHSPTGNDSCIDKSPRTMTNRRDRFALIEERANELQSVFVASKLIGIHNTTRKQQAVEVFRVRLGKWNIDRKVLTPIFF